MTTKTISQIAKIIKEDWKRPNYAASPYLDAMEGLETLQDSYYCDSGSGIVAYFLANASTWRGEVAKAVKKELNSRLKEFYR